MNVEDIGDAYKQENQYLSTDTFKANFTGKRVIGNCTHDTGDVVDDNKGDKSVEQAITATKEVAKPATNASKDKLNCVPEFFH